MIIKDRNGNVFLDYFKTEESSVYYPEYQPITHSLILAMHNSKYLLVFDKWKNYWEVPGGGIENNESPRECAVRELREETNQVIKVLNFKGIMKYQLKPDNRIEYGALFSGELDSIKEFSENNEIKQIVLWDKISSINVNEIDKKLLEYY